MSTKHQKSVQASGKNDSGQEVKLVHQEAYQGPLPHPDLLVKYEEIIPGSAERILSMAEKEQQHRHQLENEVIKKEIAQKGRGLNFGFTLALLIIVVGAYLLIIDKSLQGFSLILGSIAMIIAPFFFNKNNNQNK
ncbi:DUF2335 domain-containing protein [Cetobacterium somerae]|uniref:DUF2335 domain-containing protein n=1 Tax=Cetobacterium somerae TaxID=188913 RepID=UPI00248D7A1E|nr:DUF2335 domain-containing protein [Cetobacterium somerae]